MSRDDFGDDDRDERDQRPTRRGDAAARVRTPGTLLFLCGLIMMVMWVLNLGLLLSGYDVSVAVMEWMEQMQPPGPGKQEMQKEVEKAKVRDKTFEYVQNGVLAVIGLVLNTLVIVGGLKMKQLKSHTLAVVGSVCALIPCNSCCCVGFPIGLWALIVLLNTDVKAAFAARTPRSDAERDTWDADENPR